MPGSGMPVAGWSGPQRAPSAHPSPAAARPRRRSPACVVSTASSVVGTPPSLDVGARARHADRHVAVRDRRRPFDARGTAASCAAATSGVPVDRRGAHVRADREVGLVLLRGAPGGQERRRERADADREREQQHRGRRREPGRRPSSQTARGETQERLRAASRSPDVGHHGHEPQREHRTGQQDEGRREDEDGVDAAEAAGRAPDRGAVRAQLPQRDARPATTSATSAPERARRAAALLPRACVRSRAAAAQQRPDQDAGQQDGRQRARDPQDQRAGRGRRPGRRGARPGRRARAR